MALVAGGSMRDKGKRRFRPGWEKQPTDDGGIDNPALDLDPVVSASFSIGDPEEPNRDVAITVTDCDNEDTSMV